MKIINLTFILTVLLSMVEVQAYAYDFEIDGIYYNFLTDDDSSVGVAGCKKELEEVNIPMRVYYGGGWLKVKEICESAFYMHDTYNRSYVLPNTIEVIRKYAFALNEVYTITLPSSLKRVEYEAFYNTPIAIVRIPASVEEIGEYAFGGTWDTCPDCDDYVWARYPQKYEVESGNQFYSAVDGLLYDKQQTKLLDYPDGLGNAIIHVPNTVKEFKGAGMPQKIYVNSKTWYELDKGIEPRFISRTYDDYDNLISGPTHIIYDGDTPLGPVNGDLIIPEGVERIGENMFAQYSYNSDWSYDLQSISLPKSLKAIGKGAFSNNLGLTAVRISDLTAWCNVSFASKESTPLAYAHHLFLGEEEVKDLVIPNGVTSIGSFAFYGCSDLTSVTIPKSVTSIGSSSFEDCSSLKYVTVESETPLAISSGTFSNRANATLYVPQGSREAYLAADYWKDFEKIIEPSKCATPTISFTKGKLHFDCETEGVTFHYTITTPSYEEGKDNDFELSTKYKVTVYATKEDYIDSDEVITEVDAAGLKGDVNEDGQVTITDAVGIVDIILNEGK